MEQILNGRYKIIDEIGRGAFSSVYLAYDIFKSQNVAIKQMNTESEKNQKMFDSEHAILKMIKQKMDEKRIIQQCDLTEEDKDALFQLDHLLEMTEECFKVDNYSYLVMKHYENAIEFSSFLKECHQNLTQRSLLIYYRQILSGLKFLHDLQIYHRDLKFDNFLYCPNEDKLVIIDFGFAVYKESDDTEYRSSMMFSSPQITLHEKCSPEKNDVWAMGIILYYLINRQYPLCKADVNIREFQKLMNDYFNDKLKINVDDNAPFIVRIFLNRILTKHEQNRPKINELYNQLTEDLNQNNNIQIIFPSHNDHIKVNKEANQNLSILNYLYQDVQTKQQQAFVQNNQITSQNYNLN